jgi:branched-chain amino acid transport system substrate-binding protein
MKQVQSLLAALLGALALAATPCAHAQNTIKVGVIAAFSGPFADYGGQIEAGMKAYMKEHGDTVAGKKIELITRDTKGPAPVVSIRL